MTDTDRLVVWLRETMDAASQSAKAAAQRAWSPHWEYDECVREIRDLNNGNTLAYIGIAKIGKFTEANDPASVLRRIASDRKLLADFLSEPHASVRPGGSTEIYCAADSGQGDPCECGRDARVQRRVRLLAEGWGWTEETT